MDALFSFLRRKTDFFSGASPEQIQELVMKVINKHSAIAAKDEADKKAAAEKEKKRKEALEKKKKVGCDNRKWVDNRLHFAHKYAIAD
jgi:ribosomal protein S15P/S13E